MPLLQKPYRIACLGPESSASSYLRNRFHLSCVQLGSLPEIYRSTDFDVQSLGDRDRIVLTCANRVDYPDETIAALMANQTIVPWGVVTDTWHTGSRRSGEGVITHWQQPWFRWWDSWFGWFFPEAARPGSLTTNAYSPIVTPIDYALPSVVANSSTRDSLLAILCACTRTGAMLEKQAAHAGWSARVLPSVQELASSDLKPDFILWDDSLLPCLPQIDLTAKLDELLKQLQQTWPTSGLVASVGLENICLWPAVQERGCVDLLVKPSSALGLSNFLYHQSSQRQLA